MARLIGDMIVMSLVVVALNLLKLSEHDLQVAQLGVLGLILLNARERQPASI